MSLAYVVLVQKGADTNVSQEAYETLEDAQTFVFKRLGIDMEFDEHIGDAGYVDIEKEGTRYIIKDVMIKKGKL